MIGSVDRYAVQPLDREGVNFTIALEDAKGVDYKTTTREALQGLVDKLAAYGIKPEPVDYEWNHGGHPDAK
jgi:hypothetical protein